MPLTPHGLAIVFDKSVNPEYRDGIVRRLLRDTGLKFQGSDGCEVVVSDSEAPSEALAAERDLIHSAAVGLRANVLENSWLGLGYIVPIVNGGQPSFTVASKVLTVTPNKISAGPSL